MGGTIDLNYELQFLAHKIRDVLEDRALPTKKVTLHIASAQDVFPQTRFRFGHVATQRMCKRSKLPVVVAITWTLSAHSVLPVSKSGDQIKLKFVIMNDAFLAAR
jgi:hypothetical protein